MQRSKELVKKEPLGQIETNSISSTITNPFRKSPFSIGLQQINKSTTAGNYIPPVLSGGEAAKFSFSILLKTEGGIVNIGGSKQGQQQKSTLSEFSKSFYDSKFLSQELAYHWDMGKTRGKKRKWYSPSPVQRRFSPRKRKTIMPRKSLKRESEDEEGAAKVSKLLSSVEIVDADDSVVILSPNNSHLFRDDGLETRGCHSRNAESNISNNQHAPKRIRLLPSTSTSTRSSGNETIDLVDDDDLENSVELAPVAQTPELQEEIILLSDEECEDAQNKITEAATSYPNIETQDSEDCEIIAVKVIASTKSPGGTTRRKSLRNSGKFTAIPRSSSSISYNDVKLAVDRAKRRISSSNLNLAVVSHGIRKKKKNKKKKGAKDGGTQVQDPSLGVCRGISDCASFDFRTSMSMPKNNRKPRPQPQRRTTSPIFVLDREVGPQNPNFVPLGPRIISQLPSTSTSTFNLRPPAFIPLGGGLRGPLFQFNPRMNIPLPPQTLIPAEPNFISVSTNENKVPGTLRPIVIDGSNVAMGHRGNKTFSCRGIQICVEFFKRRGHDVVAFVPQYRRKQSESTDTDVLDTMETEGTVKFTPSREVGGQRIASYDDRFIVQYAHLKEAIIISNDNFRDIYDEEPEWRDTLRFRILQFTWMDESCIMFPRDPLGRTGPFLEEFLRF